MRLINLLPVFLLFGLASATSPFTMNIVSNTLYQNTNSSSLAIYSITHSAELQSWLGTVPSNMLNVITQNGGSITISSIVYSVAGYNMSDYMLVEPNEYYKFNYTTANFIGQWLPAASSGSGSSSVILSPALKSSQYSPYAELAYAIGLLLFIALLFLSFNVFHEKRGTLIKGIAGLSIGMISFILITFSLFYQSSISYPTITFTSANVLYTIHNQTLASMPMGQSNNFGFLAYAIMFMDIILSFAYLFMSFIMYSAFRDKKRFS